MALNFKTFRLLSADSFRSACNYLQRLRYFSSRKLPPSQSNDPHCHPVDDNCESARNAFKYVLPFNKNMKDIKRQKQENLLEKPCCVLRSAVTEPCSSSSRKRKREEKKPPHKSMWEPPFRPYEAYCKGMLPRFDAIYYKPSNKSKLYQRTWLECPPVRERFKKVCCLDGIQPPEVEKRVKVKCPSVACRFDYSRMRHIYYNRDIDPTAKCSKIQLPCCKAVRGTSDCRRTRKKEICRRLRPPLPCYSDLHRHDKPRSRFECPVRKISICEAFHLQRRRKVFGIKDSYC